MFPCAPVPLSPVPSGDGRQWSSHHRPQGAPSEQKAHHHHEGSPAEPPLEEHFIFGFRFGLWGFGTRKFLPPVAQRAQTLYRLCNAFNDTGTSSEDFSKDFAGPLPKVLPFCNFQRTTHAAPIGSPQYTDASSLRIETQEGAQGNLESTSDNRRGSLLKAPLLYRGERWSYMKRVFKLKLETSFDSRASLKQLYQ
ncbi:hypothetical protein G7Y89_g4023 [Cudoniella acicularis]|uniref:Uncharacterized protein n=1 Tax=Cudoniella acicularis TaxID=354080 RepID=A0A8H4RT83_9HELO|nr:hypothetical protein G7Y89_g4023 [Cudoniella acicularis]